MANQVIVTGAAGFIGSHLCEKLLSLDYEVVGVDCLTDYYSPALKERNLQALLAEKRFTFLRLNLSTDPLAGLFDGVDFIFHLAAQPGVRGSWGKSFDRYVENNIIATQRLLEEVKGKSIQKFVFASSSSVYGNLNASLLREDMALRPVSPYGVTKLASEALARLYWENYGVPVVSLRLFTVFGPRQRPDMAIQKLIEAALTGREFTVYGNGQQTRDFTYVSDVVEACVSAAQGGKDGEVYNVGGGNVASLNDVIATVREITGASVNLKFVESQKGDVQHTCADVSRAKNDLGFNPKVSVLDGLKEQTDYYQQQVYSMR